MEFHFPAASFDNTERAAWFHKRSPRVLEQVVASAALALIFPPKKVNGMFYMDGGFFTDVPITKAIEQGATEVMVILLSPLESQFDDDIFEAERNEKMGITVLSFMYHCVHRSIFLMSDLRYACAKYPNVPIRAIIPPYPMGKITDFTAERIQQTINIGYSHTKQRGFVNLCEAAANIIGPMGKEFKSILKTNQENAEKQRNNTIIGIVIGVVGAAVGAIAVIAVMKRSKTKRANIVPLVQTP